MAGTAVASAIQHRSRGVVRTEVALTCDSSDGSVAATVVGVGFGRVVQCFYDGGLDASAVITVADKKTGATLFTYTTGTEGTPATFRPTTNVVTVAGATIAAADTAPNVMRDVVVGGKVTVAVASGGNSETGKFVILVDENPVQTLKDKALTV